MNNDHTMVDIVCNEHADSHFYSALGVLNTLSSIPMHSQETCEYRLRSGVNTQEVLKQNVMRREPPV
jgi:hypothetical protein